MRPLLDEEENQRARKRKKPWRYRLPDLVQEDILARLLALNQVQAVEQGVVNVRPGAAGKAGTDADGDVDLASAEGQTMAKAAGGGRKVKAKPDKRAKQQKSEIDLPLFGASD